MHSPYIQISDLMNQYSGTKNYQFCIRKLLKEVILEEYQVDRRTLTQGK